MKLYFHHQHKTGGTAVSQALYRAFEGKHRIIRLRNQEDVSDPHYDVFSSHFAFHPSRFIKQDGDVWATWVRNPVERFYSAWKFWKVTHHNYIEDHYPEVCRVQRQIKIIRLCDTFDEYALLALNGANVFPFGTLDELVDAPFDFVGRQWSMQEDMDNLMHMLGRDPVEVGHVNVSSRSMGAIYGELQWDQDLQKLFKEELDKTNTILKGCNNVAI